MTKLVCMFHDYVIAPKNVTKEWVPQRMKWYKINSVVNFFCHYNNDPISMKKEFLHRLNNYHLFREPDMECGLEGLTIQGYS